MRLARAVLLTARDMLIIVLSVAWSGCAAPPRGTPATLPAPSMQVCFDDELVAPFLCDRVTKDGYECALCAQKSCVTTTFIYCTGSLACDDPLCAPRQPRKRK